VEAIPGPSGDARASSIRGNCRSIPCRSTRLNLDDRLRRFDTPNRPRCGRIGTNSSYRREQRLSAARTADSVPRRDADSDPRPNPNTYSDINTHSNPESKSYTNTDSRAYSDPHTHSCKFTYRR